MTLGTRSWLLGGVLVAVPACFPPDDGRDPPLDRIYFPVGLAVSSGDHRLYVANSDFDLQFNAGSLQVYDVDRLREFLPRYCTGDSECAEGERCDLGTADAPGSHWCVASGSRDPCGALGEKTPAERLLSPGRCGVLDPVNPPRGRPLLIDSVGIGAFVTDVLYRERPPDDQCSRPGGGRLFLPVRGDATLHWVDVAGDDGEGPELECGQGRGDECDGAHRRGDEPAEENTRDVTLPPEPFALAADESGSAILTTHQTEGQVGLFVNDWENGTNGGPRLEFVLSGLAPGAVGIASLPEPELVSFTRRYNHPDAARECPGDAGPSRSDAGSAGGVLPDAGRGPTDGGSADAGAAADAGSGNAPPPERLPDVPYQPGFLVTFRTTPEVRLVRYFDDEAAHPGRPFLNEAGFEPITALAQGFNSRGVAVDATARKSAEAACDQSDPTARVACLAQAARVPLDVFIANRSPPSLLIGETRSDGTLPANDLPFFYRTESLQAGPSRVVLGEILDRDGKPARRVFVVCFDSRQIFVYDPVGRRIETIIRTGRGPHAFVTLRNPGETGAALGFIGHFTDSYIGVVDLNQQHVENYGEIILTVGKPTPPRASK